MSAYGTKQTSCSPIWMSAFRGKAEIPASRVNVRYSPGADLPRSRLASGRIPCVSVSYSACLSAGSDDKFPSVIERLWAWGGSTNRRHRLRNGENPERFARDEQICNRSCNQMSEIGAARCDL
jgi:hypothetical protein